MDLRLPVELGGWLLFAAFAVMAVIHIGFAVGCLRDAKMRKAEKELHFASPWLWGLATLIGGVFALTAYWLINVSRLTRDPIGTTSRATWRAERRAAAAPRT